MKNILRKQIVEHKERARLQNQIKAKEFLEMEERIKEYQTQLDSEAKLVYDKRSKEKAMMSDNIHFYKLNSLKQIEMDMLETKKENPSNLAKRELQDRELSQKRVTERKLLDMCYKRNIESNQKNKFEFRSIEKNEANSSRSFLEVLNEK